MVDDAVAVLDALGWQRAHVFGHSLGGVVAQRLALRHPDRVLSVVSSAALPSDVSGSRVARYLRVGLLARLAAHAFPEGREGDIEASLRSARGIASPGYPFDETAAREWIERAVDSGPRDTKAQSRQIGAQWHGPELGGLRRPMLVLHGEQDPILRPRRRPGHRPRRRRSPARHLPRRRPRHSGRPVAGRQPRGARPGRDGSHVAGGRTPSARRVTRSGVRVACLSRTRTRSRPAEGAYPPGSLTW